MAQEEEPLLPANPPTLPRNLDIRKNLSAYVYLAITLLATLFTFRITRHGWALSSPHISPVAEGDWHWGKITPSRDLIWHPCYEEYDCARLDVPLDWLNPSDELRAAIAIIRYNATDRDNYLGPVFINPGGPGGSGVWFLRKLAPYYQSVVGKNHDIISFDPRGVGSSRPKIDCWESEEDSKIWALKDVGVIDAHPGVVYDAYARAVAFSQQCASKIGGVENPRSRYSDPAARAMNAAGPGHFVSTASVVRDIVEMMEKVGQEKLKYWGFSYGTYIGTTFAAMYPNKVGRIVNDGNVDAIEFSSGRGTHFVEDTDKGMNSFYHFCHRVGPEECSFYAPSPSQIEQRLDTLLEIIRIHPVIVPAPPNGGRPELVTFSNLRRMIASALYRPLIIFPPLAEALAALEAGDGKPFIALSGQSDGDPSLCESYPGPSPEFRDAEGSEDASVAILCSDAAPLNMTAEEFGAYTDVLAKKSKSAGATMVSLSLGCLGWSVRPKMRFEGPFTGNTSFPILFVANTADNVTPLRSAQQNSKGFPGSVILIQDSYGHTSLNTPSKCTAKAIRAYFQNGTLPTEGTICDADYAPFDKWDSTAMDKNMNNDDDNDKLDEALLRLMVGHSEMYEGILSV